MAITQVFIVLVFFNSSLVLKVFKIKSWRIDQNELCKAHTYPKLVFNCRFPKGSKRTEHNSEKIRIK